MTCADVRQRLLQGSSDTLAELEPHLRTCHDCRRLAAAIDGIDAELHGALDEVLSRPLAVPAPPARRFSMAIPAVVLAAAASLVLALVPSVGGRSMGSFFPDFGLSSTEVEDVIRGAEILGDDDLSAAQWGDRRDRLFGLWKDDSVSDEEARFRLLAQIGRSASLAGEIRAPYFVQQDGGMVNHFLAEAAAMNEASGGALLTKASPQVVALILGVDPSGQADAEALVKLARDNATIPWNALSESDWGERANQLLDAYVLSHDELQGEELFVVLCQLGRAAENANMASGPHYQKVDGTWVNVAWHAAATLVVARPALLDTVHDSSLRATVGFYVEQVRSGDLPPRNRDDVP